MKSSVNEVTILSGCALISSLNLPSAAIIEERYFATDAGTFELPFISPAACDATLTASAALVAISPACLSSPVFTDLMNTLNSVGSDLSNGVAALAKSDFLNAASSAVRIRADIGLADDDLCDQPFAFLPFLVGENGRIVHRVAHVPQLLPRAGGAATCGMS